MIAKVPLLAMRGLTPGPSSLSNQGKAGDVLGTYAYDGAAVGGEEEGAIFDAAFFVRIGDMRSSSSMRRPTKRGQGTPVEQRLPRSGYPQCLIRGVEGVV